VLSDGAPNPPPVKVSASVQSVGAEVNLGAKVVFVDCTAYKLLALVPGFCAILRIACKVSAGAVLDGVAALMRSLHPEPSAELAQVFSKFASV
jgi:hypothetical protein